MSDYKRFVSYLYEYIAEKKSENRGFVKVELRSGICRMQFQLNVFSLPSQTPVTVYGFIQIGSELQGFPLGQITSGKNGISGILTFPSRIAGTAYTVTDFNGLILTASNQKFYGTQWDETPILPSRFQPAHSADQKTAALSEGNGPAPASDDAVLSEATSDSDVSYESETAPSPNTAAQADAITEAEPLPETHAMPTAQSNTEMVAPSETLSTFEADSSGKTLPASATSLEADTVPETVSASGEAAMPEPGVQKNTGSIHMTSTEAAPRINPWIWVRQNYNAIRPFDDDEISDCVRISVQDFPELRAHGFRIGCNQFIHHGFQNYHHLLLGQSTSGLAAAYILGVPGIYNTNEQFMAAMFGFAYFKPGRLSKEYTFSGKTGYWYRPLEHV